MGNMNPTLSALFPNASQSCRDANPDTIVEVATTEAENAVARRTGLGKAKRGVMNKTESEYALILEAMKRKGEILRYEFEGITLRWAGIRYTPDFVIFERAPIVSTFLESGWIIKLIEIKGGWMKGKFERAVERFRHARTYWPEFQFELHQKTKDGWKRVH